MRIDSPVFTGWSKGEDLVASSDSSDNSGKPRAKPRTGASAAKGATTGKATRKTTGKSAKKTTKETPVKKPAAKAAAKKVVEAKPTVAAKTTVPKATTESVSNSDGGGSSVAGMDKATPQPGGGASMPGSSRPADQGPTQGGRPEAAGSVVQPVRRRAGFVPMVLGGIVAGAVGFGASQYIGNDSWPFSRGPTEAQKLAQVVAEQKKLIARNDAAIAALQDRLARAADASQIDDLAKRNDAQAQEIARLGAALEALDKRVAALENRPQAPTPPVAGDGAGQAALERELQAMRESVQAEIARLKASQEAAAREQAAARQAAENAARAAAAIVPLAQLRAAVDSGQPFDEQVQALAEAGVTVPDALVSHAATGVPTLQALRDAFPDAARAALREATRAQLEAGDTNPITAFLRTQLGARSLEPRQGDDPDAVLSRAEAALRAGDLDAALAQLDDLPQAGKDQMAQWVADAQARRDVVAALAALSAKQAE